MEKNGNIGVQIPFALGFNAISKDFEGDIFRNVIKLNPRITFYPWEQRRFNAGLGFSMIYIPGNYALSDPRWNNKFQFWQLGILANQSLRIDIVKRFSVGIKIGLGSQLNRSNSR